MGKEKKKEVFEAVIYFKNHRGTTTCGVQSENENQIIFKSNGFKSIAEKRMLSCIVVDSGKDILKANRDKPISGFEIYTESGSALGFNGWQLEDHLFVTKQGEMVEFYEPIVYAKTGPEDAAKNPPVQPPKEVDAKPKEEMTCIKCKQVVLESDFKDHKSFVDYGISKLCQDCQDEIFDEDEDEQGGE